MWFLVFTFTVCTLIILISGTCTSWHTSSHQLMLSIEEHALQISQVLRTMDCHSPSLNTSHTHSLYTNHTGHIFFLCIECAIMACETRHLPSTRYHHIVCTPHCCQQPSLVVCAPHCVCTTLYSMQQPSLVVCTPHCIVCSNLH